MNIHHQGFVSDPAEMFNLTSNMDIIGFSPKNNNNNNSTYMWKSFLGGKPSGQQHAVAVADTAPSPSPNSNSTSKTMNNNNTFYHQHDFTPTAGGGGGGGGVSVSETTISGSGGTDQNLMVHHHHHHHDSSATATWRDDNNRLMMVDDSSSSMVFPCEGNERPSQGLSLSLSSTNPSNIALQSFHLIRNTPPPPSTTVHQQQQNIYGQQQFLLKNSKFLLPLQDLLNEFCGLGNDVLNHTRHSQKKHWEDDNNNNNMKHSLSSLEFVDLQKRKTKLLSMLEEVDRRYKHYCNQMKAVVSSFEAVAGSGAAVVYSALALKAMSRHFRCLKDGIMEQIEATRKGMGEKDSIAPAGATRGETPRLRMLDRALRQQRAFQQINMMESHPWRPQRGLPERSVSILRAWLFEHFLHPYPSDVDKHILARQTGLSRSQVSNWFINARVRLWKPMVEEMYLEEEKEQQRNKSSAEGGGGGGGDIDHDDQEEGEEEEEDNINTISTTNNINIQMPSPTQIDDQKPRVLLRIDSECVSSIINNNNTADPNPNPKSSLLNPHDQQQFGSVDIDFSSYNNTHHQQQHSENMVSYDDQSFHGGVGGVSLTLGLQQHGGGVSLAFPAAVAVAGTQSQMFFTREQIEECEPVIHQHHHHHHHQYSLLDGEGQNMQYRNLMGSHLLHHLP